MQHYKVLGVAVCAALLLTACFEPGLPNQVACGRNGECPPAARCEVTVGVCVPVDQPAVTELRFVEAPASAQALVATTPVTLELLDATGARVSLSGGSIALSTATNPSGVELTAPVSGTAHDGLVTFGPVKFEKPGRGVGLLAEAVTIRATSEPIEVLPTPPSVDLPITQEVLSSCATIPYTLTQAQSLPVDLFVELDPDGAGPEPFRPATQAPSAPGAAGVGGVHGGPDGKHRSFTWNTHADLPGIDADGTLRITPSVHGVSGAAVTRSVKVRNAATYTKFHADGSPRLAVDIDLDGWTDYLAVSSPGTIPLPGVNLEFPADSQLNDMAVGDLDGNGLPDLVLALDDMTVVSFQRPGISGRFLPVVAFEGTAPLRTLVAADFDHDGLDELAGVEAATGAVVILHSSRTAPGHLVETARLWTGSNSGVLRVGDLDHDGWLDLVIGSTTASGRVVTVRQTASGWGPASTDSGLTGNELAIADLDQDGRAEIAALDDHGLHVASAHGVIEIPSIVGQVIALADVDRDGRTDVVTVSGDDVLQHLHVAARQTIDFAPARQVGTASGATRLIIGDTDRDGRIDIYAVTPTDVSMFLALTPRACGALPAGPIASGGFLGGQSDAADMNSDGKLDRLGVLIGDGNTPSRIVAAYGRGDGTFEPKNTTLLDYSSTFEQWDARLYPYDYDGDGATDLAALLGQSDAITLLYGDPAVPDRFDHVDLPLDLHPYALATEDMDGDGARDLVILGSTAVEIRPGDPRGGRVFGAPVTVSTGLDLTGDQCADYCSFLLDDVNRDGHTDIVVRAADQLAVLRSDSGYENGFAPPIIEEIPDGDLLTGVNLFGDGRRTLLARVGRYNEPQQLAAYALSEDGRGLERVWEGPSDPAGRGFGGAAVLDLDGDGLDEVYLNVDDGMAMLTRTPELTVRPLRRGFWVYQPEVADLDGDHLSELLDRDVVVQLSAEGLPELGARIGPRGTSADGTSGERLSLGDVSGDGVPDVAVLESSEGKVWLARQASDRPGELEADERAISGSDYIVLADLDRDARADAITPSSLGSLAFLDPGSPSPQPVCTSQPDLWPIAVGDVNGDGRPDIVASGPDGVLLFDGPAVSCSPPTMVMPYGPGRARARSISLADMNRDGTVDVVIVSDAVRLALQSPEAPGTFQITDYERTQQLGTYWDAALIDLWIDGLPDVVVATTWNGVRIFENDTTNPGFLKSSVEVDQSLSSAAFSSVALADVQGDGFEDMVAFTGTEARVFLQDSEAPGTFSPAFSVSNVSTRTDGDAVYLTDFDGDERPDLVFTDPEVGTVLIRGR